MAGTAIAAMPQVGLDHQSFCRKPRPTESSRRFRPVVRSPPGWSVCRLESSQRHTTPEAMKETDIGKRYTARKKPSPLAGLSRIQAQRKPKTRVPDEEHDGEDQQVPQRVLEVRVGQQVGVVLEPHVLVAGLGRVLVGQADAEVLEDEPVDEDADQDDGGSQEQQPGPQCFTRLNMVCLLRRSWCHKHVGADAYRRWLRPPPHADAVYYWANLAAVAAAEFLQGRHVAVAAELADRGAQSR